MIHNNVELHNVAELVDVPEGKAVRMQRVPESVRAQLEEPARLKTLNPAGAEIRFVLNQGTARVTLSSPDEPGTAWLFLGTFDARNQPVRIGKDQTTIQVSMPDDIQQRFDALPDTIADKLRFRPNVCRIVLRHGSIHLHGIEGDIRPPAREEKPARTMLSYGTSITHGAAASAFHLSYVAQTAWRLGADLLNLGVGGACRAEPAFADYMAGRNDWDFATLALSVNMIGAGFTVEEFRGRARYLVGKIAGAHSQKPVFVISIYPFFGDWADLQPNARAKPDEFRDALQEVVNSLGFRNLHFIPGSKVLTDMGGLMVDMIHPGDLAMINMGENLANQIRPILDS